MEAQEKAENWQEKLQFQQENEAVKLELESQRCFCPSI